MRATTRSTAGLGVLMVGLAVTACGHQAGQDGTAPPASGVTVVSSVAISIRQHSLLSQVPKPTACSNRFLDVDAGPAPHEEQ